jgi:hypothetical protein
MIYVSLVGSQNDAVFSPGDAVMAKTTGGTEWDNKEAVERSRRANVRRKEINKRRMVDPTTCERNYTPAEIRFMNAMQEYKQRSGRLFPTWSEVLEVLTSLGYSEAQAEAG